MQVRANQTAAAGTGGGAAAAAAAAGIRTPATIVTEAVPGLARQMAKRERNVPAPRPAAKSQEDREAEERSRGNEFYK